MNIPEVIKDSISQLAKLQAVVSKIPGYQTQADCCIAECDSEERPEVSYEDLNRVYRYIDEMTKYLSDRLSSLQESFWTHKEQGHLPAILSPSLMKDALKAIGLDGDYEVQKKVVYASTGEPVETILSIK
jgi:hypothetical protein